MAEVFGEKERPGNTDIDHELEALLQKQGARIKVVGCGGGGGNSVSRMKETGIKGCEIIAINTDAQDLLYSHADAKILIGREFSRVLGSPGPLTPARPARKFSACFRFCPSSSLRNFKSQNRCLSGENVVRGGSDV